MSTLAASPAEPVFAAFAAIDWASKEHVVASIPVAGGRIEISKLENTPEAVELWAATLRHRFAGGPVAVAIEQKRGAVIYMLSKYDHLVLYPVPPTMSSSYRHAFFPSGAKDDNGDTLLLLDLLRHHRDRLSPLQQDTPETRLLRDDPLGIKSGCSGISHVNLRREHEDDTRRAPTGRDAAKASALEALGPVPQRARLGHGARGLQPGRHRLGLSFRTTTRAPAPTAGTRTASPGICDRHQHICFALALWNGRDPILKERLFGLTGNEGNHGEDVKECYYYLDSTPTHSYMKFLYKYPQAAFPYAQLVEENRRRGTRTTASSSCSTPASSTTTATSTCSSSTPRPIAEDILIRITRRRTAGRKRADCTCCRPSGSATPGRGATDEPKPSLRRCRATPHVDRARASPSYGKRWLYFDGSAGAAVHRERDQRRAPLRRPTTRRRTSKDGINDYVVHGDADAVNPAQHGHQGRRALPARRRRRARRAIVRLRLTNPTASRDAFGDDFDAVFADRMREADEFYAASSQPISRDDARNVMRQAFAGLLWSKQFYHYVVARLAGRRSGRAAAAAGARKHGRNQRLDAPLQRRRHLDAGQVGVSVVRGLGPRVPLRPARAGRPRVRQGAARAAAARMVHASRTASSRPTNGRSATSTRRCTPGRRGASTRSSKKRRGVGDRAFLERVFHKLLLNFTWWVNRKDAEGSNVFQGGFLGLDNIGVFDRSAPLPTGGHHRAGRRHRLDGDVLPEPAGDRARAGAAKTRPTKTSPASSSSTSSTSPNAMNNLGDDGIGLWDEEDGFFYDVLHTARRRRTSR